MPTDATNAKHTPIDPALLRRIVREVIARLQHAESRLSATDTDATAVSIAAAIITAETIESIGGTPTQVFVSSKAIITPAARDAAKQRSFTINRSVEIPRSQQPIHQSTCKQRSTDGSTQIIDTKNPSRAEMIKAQLTRRGIALLRGVTLVLSDTPAKDAHHFCGNLGKRATMIATINDVDRFENELNPEVWVFDMTCINLVTATNIAARIIQLGKRS